MLDIDDFKHVNDLHGHPFGDKVLKTTARIIRQAVRQIDRVGRYGGEEFAVAMPETDTAVARAVAERLRESISTAAAASAAVVSRH